MAIYPLLPFRLAQQAAMPCVALKDDVQPDNHDATLSDMVERLAPRSLGKVDGWCQARGSESNAFPANLSPAFHESDHRLHQRRG